MMGKKQWKTIAISVATLLLLSLLVFWVFQDHYQEILRNIQAVNVPELLLLLGMGVAYHMLESAVCVTLVRLRLPMFSFRQTTEVVFLGVLEMWRRSLSALFPCKATICTTAV